MKYLRTYELYETKPEVGDYVICEESKIPKIKNFISNNIGRIFYYIDTDVKKFSVCKDFRYIVEYDNVPEYITDFFEDVWTEKQSRRMSLDEIKHWSKNKEDLEVILNTKKYNL